MSISVFLFITVYDILCIERTVKDFSQFRWKRFELVSAFGTAQNFETSMHKQLIALTSQTWKNFRSASFNLLLVCPFAFNCETTAPRALQDSHVETMKDLSKSGRVKTGGETNAPFNVSNAYEFTVSNRNQSCRMS